MWGATPLQFYCKILEPQNQFFHFYAQHMEIALLAVVDFICITLVGSQQGYHKYRSLGRYSKKKAFTEVLWLKKCSGSRR